MNQSVADKIAHAVLYEGYILYPYRPSVKTRQRWTFGGIYPHHFVDANPGADSWFMQAQFLFMANPTAAISLSAKFLHLTARTVERLDNSSPGETENYYPVDSLDIGGQLFQSWQEAVERQIQLDEIKIADLLARPVCRAFSFESKVSNQSLSNGNRVVGRIIRRQQQLNGSIEFSAQQKADNVFQLTARILNETAAENLTDQTSPLDWATNRDAALMRSLISTHMTLGTADGGFISATDPPENLRALATECQNIGCWPVLVGEEGATDTMLISPIILPDYPQIADESPGDLFDGCEIDEILTLRILTLTDEEKRQAAAVDPMAAEMLARTELLARDQIMNLHGVFRAP